MTSDLILRLLLASAAGTVVGVEREFRGHAAGTRTHALVSTGAALFTLAGIEGTGGTAADPMRVAAQVVSGIGFVGAGAILQDSSGVRGLTTASTIWVAGALGVVSAVGNTSLALVGTGGVILILSSRRPIRWLMQMASKTTEVSIGLEYELGYGTIGPLIRVASETDSDILKLTVSDTSDRRTAEMVMRTPIGEFQTVIDTIDHLESRAEVHNLRFEHKNRNAKQEHQ